MSVLGPEGRHWGAGTRLGHTLRNGMKGSQKRWVAGRMGEQEQPAWQTGRLLRSVTLTPFLLT